MVVWPKCPDEVDRERMLVVLLYIDNKLVFWAVSVETFSVDFEFKVVEIQNRRRVR